VHHEPEVARADDPGREPHGQREQEPGARPGQHERETGGDRGDGPASERAVRRHVGFRHRERGAHDQEDEPDLGHWTSPAIVLLSAPGMIA
jgi:hypothetical protein